MFQTKPADHRVGSARDPEGVLHRSAGAASLRAPGHLAVERQVEDSGRNDRPPEPVPHRQQPGGVSGSGEIQSGPVPGRQRKIRQERSQHCL